MQKNFKLYSEYHCEIYDIISPWLDGEFEHFNKIDIEPGAVYLLGRTQCELSNKLVEEIAQSGRAHIIFSNPWEGSLTMLGQLHRYNLMNLAQNKKIMILAGGDMSPEFNYHKFDNFAVRILGFDENLLAQQRTHEIFEKTIKPYKFLFLNGRHRPHRKWMLERLRLSGSLDQSLYSFLDSYEITGPSKLNLNHKGKNLMNLPSPIKLLDPYYEVDRYHQSLHQTQTMASNQLPKNIKFNLFSHEWGEIYIKPEPYIDTYFSLVTETVFDTQYSFRTEKIWKPIMMGHPWIAVANAGFYRDIRNIGFKTFDSIIDESFDSIEDNTLRLQRISQIVDDLTASNLVDFLSQCENICKYNQQRLVEYNKEIKKTFLPDFFKFITDNIN